MALALLPIGAYEPRWFMKDIHMNPAEAVQAHLDLGAERSIGMHFGTFQLTPEGIDEPPRALTVARRRREVAETAFVILDGGASLQGSLNSPFAVLFLHAADAPHRDVSFPNS